MREDIALGFDRSAQSWVTRPVRGKGRVPILDGTLRIDDTALGEAGGDFGNLKRQCPIAVLEPASIEDIVRMINFANEEKILIGPRGQGFSAYGEAQVPGGLVIRMATLRPAPVFGNNWVEVSPGLTWAQVLKATLERGLRPPVLTQTMYLSVGGTLSVGGVDGGSYRYGAQVDNVLELQVVTGKGKLETCNEVEDRELFDGVLAGRGQCGVIVRAKLRLIPADTHTRFFQLLYRDLDTMLDDQRTLIADGRFDRISSYASPFKKGGWSYYLQGAWNFTPPTTLDEAELLTGLRHLRGFERVSTETYFDYADRGGRHRQRLVAEGRANLPHPFFNAFLPDSAINEFTTEVFASLDPRVIEPDFPIEFYGMHTALCTRPLFRLPFEPLAFLIDVLTTYANQELAERAIDLNQHFYQRMRELGGNLYATNTIILGPDQWREHYDLVWEQFAMAKRTFDPDNILSPGPHIFQGR